MKRVNGATLVAIMMLCAPALAATPKVGDAAPELGKANWVMNQPRKTSMAQLKGEVIFVEKWGVRCPPCVALIPHIEKLQKQYGARGLHIFAFEAQNHTADQIKAKIAEKGGKTYPVSAGGGENYRGAGGIPVAWLAGVDGTVIWQGNPAAETEKVDALIEQEIQKVRFPGLGKTSFDKAVHKAVSAYMKKDLGDAQSLATKVAEKSSSSPEAKADAQLVLEKVAEAVKKNWALVETHKANKNYLGAFQILNWFASAMKKTEGKKAKAIIKELKKDKTVKKEIDAEIKLQKLLHKLAGKPDAMKAAYLKKFIKSKKVQGTQAANRAQTMLK